MKASFKPDRVLVAVDAPFGEGQRAAQILDSYGPLASDDEEWADEGAGLRLRPRRLSLRSRRLPWARRPPFGLLWLERPEGLPFPLVAEGSGSTTRLRCRTSSAGRFCTGRSAERSAAARVLQPPRRPFRSPRPPTLRCRRRQSPTPTRRVRMSRADSSRGTN